MCSVFNAGRITSYNVCYTKLLRAGMVKELCPRQEVWHIELENDLVYVVMVVDTLRNAIPVSHQIVSSTTT